ncbi:Golgin sub A member 2 [Geranomyces michiganensis]|nr:Golgin sub A member 2 [Geranomyces michiganensis]
MPSSSDKSISSFEEGDDEHEDDILDDDEDDRDTEDPDARTLLQGEFGGQSSELLKREFEYIRLNKELQSKSARVVRDAEEVVKEGKATLVRPMTAPSVSQAAENGIGPSAAAQTRPGTATRPLTAGKGVKSKARVPSASTRTATSRPASGVEDAATCPGPKPSHPVTDDVPEAVGAEVSNRLLKAKLQVMQHDMDKLIAQHEVKNTTIQSLEQKLKTLESERYKNARTIQNLHGETNKYQSQSEELKRRAESAEAEVVALKKTLDVHNRAQRHSENEGNAKDVRHAATVINHVVVQSKAGLTDAIFRLNRALDEIERRKQLASKASTDAKEKLEESKRTLEKLLQDHRRVHKQKAELLVAFKKQLQLVDVLKRQKIHLESAKLLEIAEQDFVRALNWEV